MKQVLHHDSRCENASHDNCRCSCGGKLHGRAVDYEMDSVNFGEVFKIGDIVRCYGYKKCEGMLGFVHEIVRLPRNEKQNRFNSGQYSIYGLNKVMMNGTMSSYFGDFVGADLISTGEKMTKERLNELRRLDIDNVGYQNDIDFTIEHLGESKVCMVR